jgi:hypothetical protein
LRLHRATNRFVTTSSARKRNLAAPRVGAAIGPPSAVTLRQMALMDGSSRYAGPELIILSRGRRGGNGRQKFHENCIDNVS